MDPITGAIIGGGISAVGNWITGNSAEKSASREARRAREYDEDVRHLERSWFQMDKGNDRAYAARILANDRNYTRKIFLQDRQNEREYLRQQDQRARSLALEDRAINRADAKADYEANRKRFYQDSFNLRRENDERARLQAGTRGIDFQKLVKDAQAAGFNPMTALSMAHAYSTEVDYASNNRQTFTGQLGTPQMAGGGISSGGGGGGYAAPVSGGVAAGNFSSSGTGYTGGVGSGFSSAGFMAEAIGEGVETWFNRKAEQDHLAKLLEAEKKVEEMDKAQGKAPPPANFGTVLTAERPFKAAVSVAAPAFAKPVPQAGPGGVVSKPRDGRPPNWRHEERILVSGPQGQKMNVFKDQAERVGVKFGDNVSPGEFPEFAGEIVGEGLNAAYAEKTTEQNLGQPLYTAPDWLRRLKEYGASGTEYHSPATGNWLPAGMR